MEFNTKWDWRALAPPEETGPDGASRMGLTGGGIWRTVGRAMRPVRSLLIYFAAVFVGGALLAPWLYFLVQNVAPHSRLAGQPFHRYLDRSLLGLALIGLWPLVRRCGFKSWSEMGMVNVKGRGSELGTGFLLGVGSLLALLILGMMCGAWSFGATSTHVGSALAGGIAAAIIVSFLEELLFRGALFGLLRRAMDWRVAAFLSSVIYATVHFLQKADLPGSVSWKSGLDLLPLLFRDVTNPQVIFPAILNLTVVGAALAVAYQRTGALYGSMGLHAGWILGLKGFQLFIAMNPKASVALWGGENPLNGWLTLPLLAAVVFVVIRWKSQKRHV